MSNEESFDIPDDLKDLITTSDRKKILMMILSTSDFFTQADLDVAMQSLYGKIRKDTIRFVLKGLMIRGYLVETSRRNYLKRGRSVLSYMLVSGKLIKKGKEQ